MNLSKKFFCYRRAGVFNRALSAATNLEHSAEVQIRSLRDAMKGKGKFEDLGIGGMDDVLNNVFQRAFS